MLSIIVPAYNEESVIGACLSSLAEQTGLPADAKIDLIISCNACRDRTADVARSYWEALERAGFSLTVLETETPGKPNALNLGDAAAKYANRAYIDADIVMDPTFVAELIGLLDQEAPIYASGTLKVARSPSQATRAYARVWSQLPFVAEGVPGIGIYAMNAAGRARWDKFPDIIADDKFVRLNFSAEERAKTKAGYLWALPDGFWTLVRVRHRWSRGNKFIAEQFPNLLVAEGKRNMDIGNLYAILRRPLDGAVFVAVFLIGNLMLQYYAKKRKSDVRWFRDRKTAA